MLVAAGILTLFVIPKFTSVHTGCIFNKITGLYCPGCGISRGLYSILRGDISRAIHYNLLLVTAVPLSAIWCIVRIITSESILNIKKYDNKVIAFFISIVLIFAVLRNIQSPVFIFLRP